MKYCKVIPTITLAALLMAACGTVDKEKENVGGSPDTGYEEPIETPTDDPTEKEIVLLEEDAISVAMEEKENKDKTFLFILENTTDKDIELTFSNLQEFDFIIRDYTRTKVYQYSDERMFGEAFMEKTIEAKEKYVMEVDLEDVLGQLENGLYSIEIWSSARETDGLRTEIDIQL